MAVTSNLVKVVATMEGLIRAKNEAVGVLVENRAKALCPVDTGRLRASNTHESSLDGVIIGTNVEYAPFVHMGTVHQTPQPWLTDAVQQASSEIQGIYLA